MNNYDDLKARIKAAQDKSAPEKTETRDLGYSNLAARVGTEMTAAIIVGGLLGYGVDLWFGTKPWFFITLLFFGIAAGFMNIFRLLYGNGQSDSGSELHSAQNPAKEDAKEKDQE